MSDTRVFSTVNLTEAELVRQVLELEGIPAEVRNESTVYLLGELPASECMVEVWIPSEHASRASTVLAELRRRSPNADHEEPCPTCGAPVAEALAVCWSCSSIREGLSPSAVPGAEYEPRTGHWQAKVGAYVVYGVIAVLVLSVAAALLDRATSPDPLFEKHSEQRW